MGGSCGIQSSSGISLSAWRAEGTDLQGPGGRVNPAWLASTADRERTVGVLRAGFTEGRLTQDELDDRLALAYAARTYGHLWALTADLPTGVLPYPPGAVSAGVAPSRPAGGPAPGRRRAGQQLEVRWPR